jgi:ATP-dependent Clp protease ATP-binding subunit ClpC
MPIEGRRDEMLQMVRTLSRKTKNNPVLIGEAGVGKTAIVEGLAQRIAKGKNLIGKRIIELNIASLVGGTKYRGEFEERLNRVIEEAKQHPEVILFLDEIHNLVGTGRAEGSMDAANILKPALARGEISCIGATTIAEYRKYIEKDAALERRFQPVMINEPSPEEAVRILLKLKSKFEGHHKVTITEEAIVCAVELSVRYLPYRQLPDKAVDIIDEACASVQVPQLSMVQGIEPGEVEKSGGGAVDEKEVAEVISKLTGIPVSKLTEKDVDKLLNLEKYLKERVKGQDEAVKTVANKIRLARTGMRDKNRPLSVFLFLGPTGIGKTLLAKTIADVLFGSEKEMIRFDMSEYMEKHTVSKLIGAPPGYVGYEEEGQLTSKLRSKPYSVVLLDEVEKAHPDVWNVFLQLFDEGRLTDSKGRTIDGRNAIFIMTSNLPPENRMGFKVDATSIEEEQTLSTVRKSFRPEFLNRIDKIIIFKHLSRDIIKDIVKQQLKFFSGQMSKEYGISLSFSGEILDLIVEAGYSQINGAREIQRTIERLIKEPLSEDILHFQSKGEEIKESMVKVERQNEAIRIVWGSKGTTPPTQPPDSDIDE